MGAWKILLGPHGLVLTWGQILRFYLLGFFLNNVIPGGVGGEVFKAYFVAKATGKVTPSIASIVLVRYLSFLSLIVISFCATLLEWGTFEKSGILIPILGIIAFLVLAFLASLALFFWGARYAGRFLLKFTMGVPLLKLMDDFMLYGRYGSALLRAFSLTMITPVMEGVAYFFIARAFAVEVPFIPFLVLIPILTVIYHIPVTVNAVGTQDAAIVLFWKSFGVDTAHSLSISLVAHALKIIVATLGALSFLFSWHNEGRPVPKEGDLAEMAGSEGG
ncbi:MAG: lysylphosphatidylglycerol synthase transmembrane domain-containing protein [Candidatus Eremiobacteraeota bacterium]|nr:lysylphosphatidylglycerol synthase transmembrane domain-containing protein [Candidatus Eremiobacteraeota bacterium]